MGGRSIEWQMLIMVEWLIAEWLLGTRVRIMRERLMGERDRLMWERLMDNRSMGWRLIGNLCLDQPMTALPKMGEWDSGYC